MRKLIATAALATTLALTPGIAAQAAPATQAHTAKPASVACAIPLLAAKIDGQNYDNIHTVLDAILHQEAAAEARYAKPTQWNPKSTWPAYISVDVTGSSWNNYFIVATTHSGTAQATCHTYSGFYNPKTGYVYNR